MNLRMFIVRHGLTDWNATHRFQGQTDISLNLEGEKQARAAGKQLARMLMAEVSQYSIEATRIDAIYTSDLKRARRTAEIIQSILQETDLGASVVAAPPTLPDPRLREMCFGGWEGLTYTEIQQRHPEALKRWETDLEHSTPPGGETLQELAARVAAARGEILAAHPQGTILVVSHGGPLQMWIAQALGLPPSRFWQLHLANASISELTVYPEGAILNLLNSCAHLI